MIIGHIGVALATRSQWRRIPLAALLLATFAPDLLRELLAVFLLPLKQTNLYSHALPWSVLLAFVAATVALAVMRDRTSAVVVFGVVLSHIALDMISGNKPLWNSGPEGIDLGHVEQAELLVETVLLLSGWYLLRRVATPAWTRNWAVPAFLIVLQAVALLGSISQRPYATRCLASPLGACTDNTWITKRWATTPFW